MSHSSSSRRDFLKKAAAASVAATVVGPAASATAKVDQARNVAGPVVVASANGLKAVERALEVITKGGSALDGVVAGVNLVENDPDDITVGYGGLPNEQGVIQLDSCVMHGPTGRAGAVAAIEQVKNPSLVARLVMERTDHVLLVGQGAQDFARMHGVELENLMTEKTRKIWVEWKENLSTRDDYLPPHGIGDKDIGVQFEEYQRHWGTINCDAIDLNGDISGVTTTSGLFFKIPGRVGDSPIIGAGLYVDNEVGAAGSTGRGEANLENLSSFLIVERMRMGDSPEEACLYACQRIADHTKLMRLQDERGRPNFNVKFYALNKAGDVGGAELRGGKGKMAVADSQGSRLIDLAYLYKNDS